MFSLGTKREYLSSGSECLRVGNEILTKLLYKCTNGFKILDLFSIKRRNKFLDLVYATTTRFQYLEIQQHFILNVNDIKIFSLLGSIVSHLPPNFTSNLDVAFESRKNLY